MWCSNLFYLSAMCLLCVHYVGRGYLYALLRSCLYGKPHNKISATDSCIADSLHKYQLDISQISAADITLRVWYPSRYRTTISGKLG